MAKFYVKNNAILQRVITEIREIQAKKQVPIVSVLESKKDRSYAQNRLMHKWFKDIHNMTQNGIEYEAGRCKYAYFLPNMAASDNENAIAAYELIREIEQLRGYEYVCQALGKSLIASTRTLTTNEFANALSAMQHGECEYCLTDPSLYGLELNNVHSL